MSDWAGFKPDESGEDISAYEIDDLLASLTGKSLVVRDEITGRYHMLESIRAYGRASLAECGEAIEVRNLHQAFFAALAGDAEPQLQGGTDQSGWLHRLEREHDNLRTALEWDAGGPAGEPGEGIDLRMAGALWPFWRTRSHYAEGREHLERALLKSEGTRTGFRAKALQGLGILAYFQGEYLEALALTEENLSISRELGNRKGISAALNSIGLIYYFRGEYEQARTMLQQSLDIDLELGDKRSIALMLNNLGLVTHELGDHDGARTLHEQSLALNREAKSNQGTALSLLNLGNSACDDGDYEKARTLLEESLSLHRELGDKSGTASCLGTMRRTFEEQGDYASTRPLQGECLELCREIGSKTGIASSLEVFANLARVQDQTERAARLWGAAETLREQMGFPLMPFEVVLRDRQVAQARASTRQEAFEAAWAEGRKMTSDLAIALALEDPVA